MGEKIATRLLTSPRSLRGEVGVGAKRRLRVRGEAPRSIYKGFANGWRPLTPTFSPPARGEGVDLTRGAQQALRRRPRLRGDLGAGEHAGDFLAAVIGGKRVDAGGNPLALVERVL